MVRKQCWRCGLKCLLSSQGNIMKHSPPPKDGNLEYPPKDSKGKPIICWGSGTRPTTVIDTGERRE